jgi:hypothetical protein
MVVSESNPGSEGIEVHGDWTVEVRNPDGSLATKKQFTNKFIGQHIVAGLLSYDLEQIKRYIIFSFEDMPNNQPKCAETYNISLDLGHVLAQVTTAPNADTVPNPVKGHKMSNSVWNAGCTVEMEIAGNESAVLTSVATAMSTNPKIMKYIDDTSQQTIISSKTFAEPIEVWDGQVVATTVILSVD